MALLAAVLSVVAMAEIGSASASQLLTSLRNDASETARFANPTGETVADLSVLAVPATFTVNTVDDEDDATCDGTHCSLREAINASNANVGFTDTIKFNIPGSGPHTIHASSTLPTITDPVIIDGYTQSGASPNTNGPDLGSNAVLMIEPEGSNAGSGVGGLRAAADC